MKLKAILETYFAKLYRIASRRDAREESYYECLNALLSDSAKDLGRDGIHITTLPRPTEGGNPDFRVWDGNLRIAGYIEAKLPGNDLREVCESAQLRRYRETFPNLILTDFFSFWLYRNGALVNKIQIGRPFILKALGTSPPVENVEGFARLLDQFLGFSLPQSLSAEQLAKALAHRTRFLADAVLAQLREDEKSGKGRLGGFYEAFRAYLIGHIDAEQFADLYAQTITYGLFAARTRAKGTFRRRDAVEHIPATIGILHDIFEFISWGKLPDQLAWIVDDIAEVLAVADAGQILDRFYREGKGSDPIVHFYETFLAEYDPTERERRGVYYTPEPVVSYIVRSVQKLLVSEFGLREGLAAKGVTLLDPAAGTMTFVAWACREAVRAYVERYGEGGRAAFLREQILPHFYGFELMMAPYAVGHLKMGFYLDELGYRMEADERFRLYLTNTLEMEELEASRLPGLSSLAEESRLAGEIKKEAPILVILGNPPYSGHSANMGSWILGQIEEYKRDAPELRRPGQAKWLQNDYVKFLRFAQWKIDQADQGVIAMITDHSWLDNPTFRGMRQSLMRSFEEIRILDLHGGSRKKERAPDGSPDENVFDIQQGVAISFFVKRPSTASGKPTPRRIAYAEIWGSRKDKYTWLQEHDAETSEWQTITPKPRFFVLRPSSSSVAEDYDRFISVPQIFSQSGSPAPGIVTTHDDFAISWSREEAAQKVRLLLGTRSEDEARALFRLCSQSQWSYERAKKELAEGEWRKEVLPVLFRPFDWRWTVFNRNVAVHRRKRIMRHLLAGENVALITTRQHKGDFGAYCCQFIGTHKTVSAYDINYYFPLYIYPETARDDLFRDLKSSSARRPNLAPQLLPLLESRYLRPVTPEDVFSYVYAVLYTPFYRETYAEFLRIDFPRIPLPAESETFDLIVEQGNRLVHLHLLDSPEVDPPLVKFPESGDNKVAQTQSKGFHYDEKAERVWINRHQFFAPISDALWEFRIGGYQVLEKWLGERKGQILSAEDIKTYCRIATAISKTIEIQSGLDELYLEVEARLLSLDDKDGEKGRR